MDAVHYSFIIIDNDIRKFQKSQNQRLVTTYHTIGLATSAQVTTVLFIQAVVSTLTTEDTPDTVNTV